MELLVVVVYPDGSDDFAVVDGSDDETGILVDILVNYYSQEKHPLW